MNKIISILLLAVLALPLAGCYEKFEDPAPEQIYTDEDFADSELISIAELKQIFAEAHAGTNSTGKSLMIEDDLVVKGRVISSDREGNVYKSLYLYDRASESAIELKLHAGNYTSYTPGMTVYVKLRGLTLGDYRRNLSIGVGSRNAEYANGNLEDMSLVRDHIKKGEIIPLTAADTLVITPENYQTLTDASLGRLIRFEGVESLHGAQQWYYNDVMPNYFFNDAYNGGDNYMSLQWSALPDPSPTKAKPENPTWSYSAEKVMGDESWPYKQSSVFMFGSAWFGYEGKSSTTPTKGNYVVRSSGYAKFKWEPIPADGEIVDVTAIYTSYTNTGGGNQVYQLLLNTSSDVRVSR